MAWLRKGFTPVQSASLTARGYGLRAPKSGWTLREVEQAVFMAWLHEQGYIGGKWDV